MSQNTNYYDSKFEYWNKEAWRNNLGKHLQEIYKTTAILIELGKRLEEAASGGNLASVEKKDKELLKFFIGGIMEDGTYSKHSLAKLTKLLYGIYVDPKEYVEIMKIQGIDHYSNIQIYRNTETKEENWNRMSGYDTYIPPKKFISINDFALEVNSLAGQLLTSIGVNIPNLPSEDEIKERIRNPQLLPEDLLNLYQHLVMMSANYNPFTFFALSTRLITYKYLATMYPKLLENFNEMKKFLGLIEVYTPDVKGSQEEFKRNYTLFGHVEGGLCDLLFKLNRYIWDILSSDPHSLRHTELVNVFKYVTEPIDLENEYKKQLKQKLIKLFKEKPDVVKGAITWDYMISWNWYTFMLSGPIIKQWMYRGYDYSYGYKRYVYIDGNKPIALSELLDSISPALFFGVPAFTWISLTRKIDENLTVLQIATSNIRELVSENVF